MPYTFTKISKDGPPPYDLLVVNESVIPYSEVHVTIPTTIESLERWRFPHITYQEAGKSDIHIFLHGKGSKYVAKNSKGQNWNFNKSHASYTIYQTIITNETVRDALFASAF
jgi:hypothetical protein